MSGDVELLSDHSRLHNYYRDYFPTKLIYDLLTLGSLTKEEQCKSFLRRELVFMTQKGGFPRAKLGAGTEQEFREHLLGRVPKRIENVSLNSAPYGQRRIAGPGFERLQKELAFDIDIDSEEYESVRTCCAKGAFCQRCWQPLMGTAVRFLSTFLQRTCGFRTLAWVFSGRRGMHCWVLDRRAREMSQEARYVLLKRLEMFSDTRCNGFDVQVLPVYRDILVQGMRLYLKQQPQLFANERVLEHIARNLFDMDSVPGSEMAAAFVQFASMRSRQGKTSEQIVQKYERDICLSDTERRAFMYQLASILCAPRIDVQVTSKMAHPIKLPFCVHPSTGNVCHAMDTQVAADFYPAPHTVIQHSHLCRPQVKEHNEHVQRFETSIRTFERLVGDAKARQ